MTKQDDQESQKTIMSQVRGGEVPLPADVGPIAIRWCLVGLVYGVFVGLVGIGLSGSGHGWGEASISIAAVLLVPLLGVAWAFRERKLGFVLAACLAIMLLFMDAFLLLNKPTSQEIESVSFIAGAWAALWGAWQFFVIRVLIVGYTSIRERKKDPSVEQ